MKKKPKQAPRYRLGYPDGSGPDTILDGETPVLVPWRTQGCGCCAGDAKEDDLTLLRQVVRLLNGERK